MRHSKKEQDNSTVNVFQFLAEVSVLGAVYMLHRCDTMDVESIPIKDTDYNFQVGVPKKLTYFFSKDQTIKAALKYRDFLREEVDTLQR